MIWVIYSLISAFSWATSDALSKKAMEKEDQYLIAWVRLGYCIPFLIPVLIFSKIPKLDFVFWITFLILIPFELVSYLLYIRAIKISPLSLTIPFLSLTPVFLIFVSFFILGELPDAVGVIGIILVSIGGYTLNLHLSPQGILEPLKAIVRERGSLYMIIVSFIFSINSTLGKLAILHSNPTFFGALYFIILGIIFTPIAVIKSKERFITFCRVSKSYFLIGFFFASMVVFHCLAISLIEVAYMISIKRSSLIFSVIYGWLIFKEENIKERLFGSLLMMAGMSLITLF
jgi:drug/metabolite transporter (DMT)-like permease